ncbi:type IV-A pilus assembly ATPase PilB, partial [Vibrio campbellii]
ESQSTTAPQAMLDLHLFEPNELTDHLSQIFGLSEVPLTRYDYLPLCQQLGLRELITRYQALPIASDGFNLTLAIADPTCIDVEDEFRFATGMQVELALADNLALKAAIRRLYGQSLSESQTRSKEISQ